MTVASLEFLAFALAVAAMYNLVARTQARHLVLLAANLFFLTTFIPSLPAGIPLLGFVGAGYAGVRLAQNGLRRASFAALIAAMTVLFFWLKRYTFLPQSSLLPFAYSVIGMSYIFFRILHIIVDAHTGLLKAPVPPIGYLNYTLNFTTLVSGPIQRYGDFARQQLEGTPAALDRAAVGLAIERIAIGLFKVVVLAAILYAVHGHMLADFAAAPGHPARITAAAGALTAYTFYLYCNFSGYTDIVIGVARFYRLELPENFDRPFSATNFLDFWTRWHMTLSGWLKTYVYSPLMLAMARTGSPRWAPVMGVAAFFITFFLIGLWHGQTSMFVVYGLLLGLGVSLNKLYQIEMANRLGRKAFSALGKRVWYRSVARGLTFTYFTISLLFFWGNWPLVFQLAGGLGPSGILAVSLLVFAVATAVLGLAIAVRDWVLDGTGRPVFRSRYTRTVWATVTATCAAAALALLASPAPDIVYKTF